MNIFNNDPNKDYNLVRGKYHSKVIAWDLITDGNMEKTRPLDLKIYGNHFWKEPGNKTSALVKLNKFQGNLVHPDKHIIPSLYFSSSSWSVRGL